jgi:hypothetical protein
MACDSPYIVTHEGEEIPVPCGRCPLCARRKTSQWAFRLMAESKRHRSAHFVTLTYNTDHVPLSPGGFMTLNKKDVQDFMKRFRKLHPKDTRIKYYCVGEYGTNNWRPHYHCIIFGSDDSLVAKAWQKEGKEIGTVDIGEVSQASILYTCGYMNKGKRVPRFAQDDRQPEFNLMSKGLGENYINRETIKFHRSNLENNFVTGLGGIKIAMPRYYRDKIFSEEDLEIQRQFAQENTIKKNNESLEKHARRNAGEILPGKMLEEIHEQKIVRLSRFNKKDQNRKL